MKLNIVDLPYELIKLKLPRVIKAGKTGSGLVTLRSEALDQEFEKSFTIELRDAENTRFTIPIVRTIRD